jgi:hypothetical protein
MSGAGGRVAIGALLLAVAAAAPSAAGAAVAAAAAVSRPRIAFLDAVERARELDGALVEYEGEAIGEAMARGMHVWVNLGDSNGALGLWIPAGELPADLSFGSWRETGDSLLVRGLFHRACPEHGGDLDIHVSSLEVTSRGGPRRHPASLPRLIAALAALALSGALLPLRRSRERERLSRGEARRHATMDRSGRAGRR